MSDATVVEEEIVDVLTVHDRCDQCGAQAYVLVIFPEDLTLTFCSHHFNENSDKLIEKAVDIIDETDKLSRR